MSKRTKFTTVTPLPGNITRATVMETLRCHTEMIDLNPLVEERHPIKPPADATPEEFHCVWYSLTDRVQYLPGDLLSGKVSYNACFHDLENGVQTHCYAPLGLNIRSKWTLGGSLPGEPSPPVELGTQTPRQGLWLREDVDMKCNIMMTSFVKKTLTKAHAALVDKLVLKAQIASQKEQREKEQSLVSSTSQFSGSQASTKYSPDSEYSQSSGWGSRPSSPQKNLYEIHNSPPPVRNRPQSQCPNASRKSQSSVEMPDQGGFKETARYENQPFSVRSSTSSWQSFNQTMDNAPSQLAPRPQQRASMTANPNNAGPYPYTPVEPFARPRSGTQLQDQQTSQGPYPYTPIEPLNLRPRPHSAQPPSHSQFQPAHQYQPSPQPQPQQQQQQQQQRQSVPYPYTPISPPSQSQTSPQTQGQSRPQLPLPGTHYSYLGAPTNTSKTSSQSPPPFFPPPPNSIDTNTSMANRPRPIPGQLEVGYNGYNPGHYRSVSYQGAFRRQDTLGLEGLGIGGQGRGVGGGIVAGGQGNGNGGYQAYVPGNGRGEVKPLSGAVELE